MIIHENIKGKFDDSILYCKCNILYNILCLVLIYIRYHNNHCILSMNLYYLLVVIY